MLTTAVPVSIGDMVRDGRPSIQEDRLVKSEFQSSGGSIFPDFEGDFAGEQLRLPEQ
jgi:hypothetical protein